MKPAYICRQGVSHSAMLISRRPTKRELSLLAEIGFEMATPSEQTYRKTIACSVNGDGYWYTRRYLLDSTGFVVGSYGDYTGPLGQLEDYP